MIASSAGGLLRSTLCGLAVLYSCRHRSIKILASVSVYKISRSNRSSHRLPLKESAQPFSHGLLAGCGETRGPSVRLETRRGTAVGSSNQRPGSQSLKWRR